MRYIIYGAGAIGGAIGASLFRSGFDVVLIGRGRHLETIQSEGLKYISGDGIHVLGIPAVSHPKEIQFTDQDVVILTMKSQDTQDALNALAGLAPNSTPIVCGQNGVINEKWASDLFARVYGMVLLIPATFLVPGEVIHHVSAGNGSLGILDSGKYPRGTDDTVSKICSDLEISGFSAAPHQNIMEAKYTKLITNLNNAVGAICGFDNDSSQLAKVLISEGETVLRAADISVNYEEQKQKYTLLGRAEIEGMPRGGSSSWQSVIRGGNIEADFLNGEIGEIAQKSNTAAPANKLIQELARQTVSEAKQPGWIAPAEILRRLD